MSDSAGELRAAAVILPDGYVADGEPLPPGGAIFAHGPDAKPVILKLLDEQCRMGGRLYPAVGDRLGRVREAPHSAVANLRQVVVGADERAWLVWEFVPGRTLEQWAADPPPSAAQWRWAVREMLLAVAALHALGLVHGRLHARNIIVTQSGRFVLTHISPLLHQEPLEDVEPLLVALRTLLRNAPQPHGPLSRLLQTAQEQNWPLEQIIATLGGTREMQDTAEIEPSADRKARRRAWMVAAIAALLMGVLTVALIQWAWHQSHPPAPPATESESDQ